MLLYTFKPGNTNKENAVTAEFDVKIGDEIVKQVSETKFLGITIDNKLSWDTHINKLSKNCRVLLVFLTELKIIYHQNYIKIYIILYLNHTLLMALLHGVVFQTKNCSLFLRSKKYV